MCSRIYRIHKDLLERFGPGRKAGEGGTNQILVQSGVLGSQDGKGRDQAQVYQYYVHVQGYIEGRIYSRFGQGRKSVKVARIKTW
jgi:hypothetical protein